MPFSCVIHICMVVGKTL